jgi:uncharacterized membrane protein
VWYIGLSFPIIFSSSQFIILTPLIKKAYFNICHQESYKVISIAGHQFFVCARCLGIYTGILIFSFASIFMRIIPKHMIMLMIISFVLILADILFYMTGLYGYSKYIGFGTGIFSGSVTFLYILNELDNYLLTITIPDEN